MTNKRNLFVMTDYLMNSIIKLRSKITQPLSTTDRPQLNN